MIVEDKTITSSPFGAGQASFTGGPPAQPTTYAIYADNREVLKAYIRSLSRLGKHGAPLIEITMPCCGEHKVYQQELNIPVNDVGPCPCGNWLIKYKEQPFQVVF